MGRNIGEERQVQEGLRFVAALPQRRDPVVPRLREYLRQLHGAPVGGRQALATSRPGRWEAPLQRGFFFARFRQSLTDRRTARGENPTLAGFFASILRG